MDAPSLLKQENMTCSSTSAIPVRDISLRQIKEWIEEDEKDAELFWDKMGNTNGASMLDSHKKQ